MPLLSAALLACLTLVAPPDEGPSWPDPAPTLEQIFQRPTLLGQRPSEVGISADGRWVSYAWRAEQAAEGEGDAADSDASAGAERGTTGGDAGGDDNAPPERDLLLANTATGEVIVLATHDDEARVHWTRLDSLALVERDGWLERFDPDHPEQREPLLQTGGGVSLQWLDDDRTVVARTTDNELFVLDLITGARHAPTTGLEYRGRWFAVAERSRQLARFARPEGEQPDEEDGDDNGRRLHLVPLDVDDERDVLVTELGEEGSHSVSPDGRWVLVTHTDRESSRDLIMADYLTEFVSVVPVRDSLAGDQAPRRPLELYDVEAGRLLPLPLDGDDRSWILRARWSPSGDRLLVERVSDDTHVRQLFVVDPATRRVSLLVSERDDAWIGGPLVWSGWNEAGDEVLFTSERTGFNHLYAVPREGGEVRALTAGDFELAGVSLLDGRDQALVVAHGEHDPAVTQLMLLSLARGDQARLTGVNGCASRPLVSADGSTVVYRWATLGVPWELHALRLGEAGGPVRLSHTVPAALGEQGFTPPEIVEFENPDDGVRVRAYLYRPEPFDPTRRYPAVMFVHGAGYLQQVQRSMSNYEPNMLFHQRLTRMGFAVIDPDFRHSRGYGRDFRTDVHGFMGGKDLDDCVAAVDYLGTLGWVDTERVGLYGGSYGGFLTLMALFTRPEVFAAGAALRSVTDWRVYNHWYTNPRLGDPQEDPEAYARSSPIDHVDGLTKPLLLLHGMQDSNVFAQDTIRLMEALIERGKDFEVMLYPSQGHAFHDPDSWVDEYKRIERLFVRELKPGS